MTPAQVALYAQAVFRGAPMPAGWPADFVIITAWNPWGAAVAVAETGLVPADDIAAWKTFHMPEGRWCGVNWTVGHADLLAELDLGIKTEHFCEVSKFVMELAKVTQPPNRPIVGDKLYEVESGIIAGWIRLAREKHPLEFVPFRPELVGQKPVNIVLGKNSGPPSIDEWAEKTGIKVTDEQRMQILLAVKAKSFEKKDLLTADEFKAIVNKVLNTNAALA